MSLFSDYEAEYGFERDFPFGVPSSTWKTKDGRKIKVSQMTEQHIKKLYAISWRRRWMVWRVLQGIKKEGLRCGLLMVTL